MMAKILAGATLVAALLPLFEILASDQTKAKSLDQLTRFWFWLDETKKWKTFEWLHGQTGFLFGGGLFLTAGFFLYFAWLANELIATIGLISLLLPVFFLGRSFLHLTVSRTRYGYIWIPITTMILAAIVIWLVNEYASHRPSPYIVLLVGYFVAFTAFVALACLPLLMVQLAKFALGGLELVVRRLAEYSKGPLTMITTALAAVAAILTFFGIAPAP